jgi:hypothetical protein
LDYVDYYTKPENIIKAYGTDITIGEVRENMMSAFKKLFLYKMVLKSAANVS